MAFVAFATMASAQVLPDGHNPLPRNGWTAVARNQTPAGYETAPSGPVAAAIDGLESSFYHSNWADGSGKTGDQAFKITLPEAKSISGVGYLPRQSGGSEAQKMTDYKIYVSATEDFDVNALPSVTPTAEGTLTYLTTTDRTQKNIVFDAPVSGKYILVVAQNVTNYFCCAELYLFTKEAVTYNYQVNIVGPADATATVNGVAYTNGQSFTSTKMLQASDVTPSAAAGTNPVVAVSGSFVNISYNVDWNNMVNGTSYWVDVLDVAGRGNWVATETILNTTKQAGVAVDRNAENQRFTIIKSSRGNHYLYAPSVNKFISKDGTYTKYSDTPEGTLTYVATNNAMYPFRLAVNGAALNCANGYPTSGVVTNWNTTDNGNSYRVIPMGTVEVDAAIQLVEEYEVKAVRDNYNAKVAEVRAWIAGHEGHADQAGSITAESLEALQNVIAGTTPSTYEQYETATAEIQTVIGAIKPAAIPEGVYTFQSNYYEALLGVYMADAGIASANRDGAHKMWEVKQEGEGYSIKNLFSGKYLGNPGTAESDAAVALFVVPSKTFGVLAIKGETTTTGHHLQQSGAKLVAWDYTTDASQWTMTAVEDLTVNTTAALDNYATFAAPFATKIPAGVTAYAGVKDGNVVKLEKIEGVIPANTGVLLKGEATQAYVFAISSEEGTAPANNEFKVALKPVATPAAGIMTLQKNNETLGVGFYPFTSANVVGFKAYLEGAPAGVQGLSLDFGGVTGIEGVAVENAKLEIFDLQGRRVNNAKSGLYIVNGQKVILK